MLVHASKNWMRRYEQTSTLTLAKHMDDACAHPIGLETLTGVEPLVPEAKRSVLTSSLPHAQTHSALARSHSKEPTVKRPTSFSGGETTLWVCLFLMLVFCYCFLFLLLFAFFGGEGGGGGGETTMWVCFVLMAPSFLVVVKGNQKEIHRFGASSTKRYPCGSLPKHRVCQTLAQARVHFWAVSSQASCFKQRVSPFAPALVAKRLSATDKL